MGLVGVVATQLWHHTYIDASLADLPALSPPETRLDTPRSQTPFGNAFLGNSVSRVVAPLTKRSFEDVRSQTEFGNEENEENEEPTAAE
jgi:hypothetical protein